MSKRVYSSTIAKWAGGGVLGGCSIIFLIFSYLASQGLIDITRDAGNITCAGNAEDPCIADFSFCVKNVTGKNNDIFIYPVNYDPYGRNTVFDFETPVKSWKVSRRWGRGYREIPLNKSCTGTWCGLSNSKDDRKFSVAFREGKCYDLRLEVEKIAPSDYIKWGFTKDYDPAFLAVMKRIDGNVIGDWTFGNLTMTENATGWLTNDVNHQINVCNKLNTTQYFFLGERFCDARIISGGVSLWRNLTGYRRTKGWVETDYTCDHSANWTGAPQNISTCYEITGNGTKIHFQHYCTHIDAPSKTCYWNEWGLNGTVPYVYEGWKKVDNSKFQKHIINGCDVWHNTQGLLLQPNSCDSALVEYVANTTDGKFDQVVFTDEVDDWTCILDDTCEEVVFIDPGWSIGNADYLFNFSPVAAVANATNFAYKIVVNVTDMDNYATVNSTCGDIEFKAENGSTLSHFMTHCNTTANVSIWYVNTSINNASPNLIYMKGGQTGVDSSFNDTFGESLIIYINNDFDTNDLSDQGNDGTVNGAAEVRRPDDAMERRPAYYHYDGNNDNTTVVDSPSLNVGAGVFSIVVMINYSGSESGNHIISKTSGTDDGYVLKPTNNGIYIWKGQGFPAQYRGCRDTNIDHPLNTSTWHSVGGLFNADGTCEVYVDGIATSDTFDSAGANPNSDYAVPLVFGDRSSDGAKDFEGDIDEGRIYSRVLVDGEWKLLFHQGNLTVSILIVNISTAPNVSNVVLNSSDATNLSDENLTVWYDASDPNNDTIKNITNWYLDSSSIMTLNMPFEATNGNESNWTKDYTDFNNHGTLNLTTWISDGGYDGWGAYQFDGIGGHVYLDSEVTLSNTSSTLTFWAKENETSVVRTLFTNTPNSFNKHIEFSNSNGGSFRLEPDTNNRDILWAITRDTNWHFYALVSDPINATLYQDGVIVPQVYRAYGTIGAPMNDNLTFRYIGNKTTYSNVTNGTIDDIRAYNHPLSAEQVKALYENKTDLIVEQETAVGDVWKACVTPNEGTEYGIEVCSNELNIIPAINISNCLGVSMYFVPNVTYWNATQGSLDQPETLANGTVAAGCTLNVTSYDNQIVEVSFNVSSDVNHLVRINDVLLNETFQFVINATANSDTLTNMTGEYVNATSGFNFTINWTATGVI